VDLVTINTMYTVLSSMEAKVRSDMDGRQIDPTMEELLDALAIAQVTLLRARAEWALQASKSVTDSFDVGPDAASVLNLNVVAAASARF
jgi:hypothetical protein